MKITPTGAMISRLRLRLRRIWLIRELLQENAYLRYLAGSSAGTPCFFTRNTTNFARFAVARVTPDDVNVIRTFIESFAGFERDGLGASQLHHDRALEHVDKGVRIVSMDFVSAARRVGDRKDESFFAGNVREGLGHDFFTSGGGAAGANCAASASAAIAIGRIIFFMTTPCGLAHICVSFKV